MRTIAIVPIKEHSERCPGKNFRDFMGRPLWMHVVGALVSSGVADEIVIDTDSPARFGVVPFSVPVSIQTRDESVRGDDVSMNAVLATVIARNPADRYIQTHATSPLLRADTIRHAVDQFAIAGADSAMSATKHQSRFWTHDGRAINHDPTELIPTQNLAHVYEENSALYVFTRAFFEANGARVGNGSRIGAISRIDAIDIDTEEDFKFAEIVARGLKI